MKGTGRSARGRCRPVSIPVRHETSLVPGLGLLRLVERLDLLLLLPPLDFLLYRPPGQALC
jgi:hypothetical protein